MKLLLIEEGAFMAVKNKNLSVDEIKQFKLLFSKFCRGEINAGRCSGDDCCRWCPINTAYDNIFAETSDDEDEEICEDELCE